MSSNVKRAVGWSFLAIRYMRFDGDEDAFGDPVPGTSGSISLSVGAWALVR